MIKVIGDKSGIILLGFITSLIATATCFRSGGEFSVVPLAFLVLFSSSIFITACYDIGVNDVARLLNRKLITEDIAIKLLDNKDKSKIKSIRYEDVIRAIIETKNPNLECSNAEKIEECESKRIEQFNSTLDYIREIKQNREEYKTSF